MYCYDDDDDDEDDDDVWIYENGAKDFNPYHPYFTLILLNFQAAFKPCKQAKNRERTAVKGR